MISEIPVSETDWLSRYFSGRNCLTWKGIASGDAPAEWLVHVVPWLKFFEGGALKRPLILPVFGVEGPTEWYGVAPDEQSAAMFSEEILSFIGPSYSDFNGQLFDSTTSDDIESALHSRFGRFVFRIVPTDRAKSREISEAVSVYQKVISRRPPIPNRIERPFGRVRSDFDSALLAGNEASARKFLVELCDSGRISEEQRKCLEIRLLAGLGRHEELARNHSLISTVMDLPLPPQTITDLVVALYETYIEPVESNSESKYIIQLFKQNIANQYGRLFRERKGIRLPKVLRAFLLFELAGDDSNRVRCEAILSAYPVDGDGRPLIDRWFENSDHLENDSRLSSIDCVRQAILDEDYEIAIERSFKEIPASWAYSALLRCAAALSSKEIAQRVLEVVNQVPEDLQKKWSAKDRGRIKALKAEIVDVELAQVDTNWVVWAQWVASGAYTVSPILKLESAVLRWGVDDYVHNSQWCIELAQLVGNAEEVAAQVFREAFPYFVEFFVDRPSQLQRSFFPLYLVLIKMIGWSGAVSADELELTSSLTQALMEVGPSKQIYTECIGDLCEIVSANSSVIHLDWALNAAEMLALYPAQDPELRLRFFMSVVGMAHASAHRVTPTQKTVLEILAKDYNCLQLLEKFPAEPEVGDSEKIATDFFGLIGIYTLTETAGQRAKQLLQKLIPKSRIELNADGVATDRLKHLASSADVFVFAWRSSKHQAYYCAKAARAGKDLILPPGKGMASIVRSVLDYLKAIE